MSNEIFKVLLIENDAELTALLEQLLPSKLSPRPSTITVKRHMDDARKALRGGAAIQFSGLLIDTMLPRTEADLSRLEDLEGGRREMLRELKRWRAKSEPEAEERILHLHRLIDEKDSEIESVQDLEGGITLLEEMVVGADRIGIPTVIFTARALPDLRRRAEALVLPGLFTWIQKPAPAGLMAGALLIEVVRQ